MIHMYLSRRNIISIDVESNGLYGQPFCVGAVEMDWGGRVLRGLISRCPLDEVEDDWVKENVLPSLKEVSLCVADLSGLQDHFISWLKEVMNGYGESDRPIVLVDAGFPVDCGFLYGAFRSIARSHEEDVQRYSPYPVVDLSSILAARGIDPDVSRNEYASYLLGGRGMMKHHPLFDAEVSALCLVRAIRDMEERGV